MIRKFRFVLAMLFLVSSCAPTVESTLPAVTSPLRPTLSSGSSSNTPPASVPDQVLALPVTTPRVLPSPAIPAPSGWKTYINTQWQVALEYPPDWSVRDQAVGVTLTSPQGAGILLAPVETGGLAPQAYLDETLLPNTRCTSETNAHGVAMRICFDTISLSYTTYMILKPTGGAERLLTLSLQTRTHLQVFNMLMASMRPVP